MGEGRPDGSVSAPSGRSRSAAKGSLECEPVVDRDTEGATILDEALPSDETEFCFGNEGGDTDVDTAEKEGDGGCICTFPDDTLTFLTLILPPSGMATGSVGSVTLLFSLSFRSATAARTSA
jgi:hypothetical protein